MVHYTMDVCGDLYWWRLVTSEMNPPLPYGHAHTCTTCSSATSASDRKYPWPRSPNRHLYMAISLSHTWDYIRLCNTNRSPIWTSMWASIWPSIWSSNLTSIWFSIWSANFSSIWSWLGGVTESVERWSHERDIVGSNPWLSQTNDLSNVYLSLPGALHY